MGWYGYYVKNIRSALLTCSSRSFVVLIKPIGKGEMSIGRVMIDMSSRSKLARLITAPARNTGAVGKTILYIRLSRNSPFSNSALTRR